jgi:hypothetical protein
MFLARRNPWGAATCAARRTPHSQQANTYLHGKDYSMASILPILKQIRKSIIPIYHFQIKSISFEHHGELMNGML